MHGAWISVVDKVCCACQIKFRCMPNILIIYQKSEEINAFRMIWTKCLFIGVTTQDKIPTTIITSSPAATEQGIECLTRTF